MTKETPKPKEILALEAHYGITLTETESLDEIISFKKQNNYLLNTKKQVIGLNLFANGIDKIENLDNFIHLTHLNLFDNLISEIENLEKLNKLIKLDLGANLIEKIQNIDKLNNLKNLNLSNNQIEKIQNIDKLNNLNLSDNQISEIENLDNLKNLTELNLVNNQISEIKNIDKLNNLTILHLGNNQISEIKNIDNLNKLTNLYLWGNQISEIKNLDKLKNLTNLYLGNNLISEIENIDKLNNLTTLDLASNQISEIENLENLKNLTSLDISDNQISEIENLDKLNNLTNLYLGNNLISEIENIDKLNNLTTLYLGNNLISEIENLDKLNNLTTLDLASNQISEIENLESLKNLIDLNLFDNQIFEIENLENLKNLTSLDISDNQISEIENLDKLNNLTNLYLTNNQISEIENLDKLNNLTNLYLGRNQISEIKNLDKLNNLTNLYLGRNQISEIKNLYKLKKLDYINLSENPLEKTYNVKLNSHENHLWLVKEVIKDTNKTVELPSKVLLLGNHASGKSSFLNYALEKQLNNFTDDDSTHILTIKEYPKEGKAEAYFYDFGGQDYYHGIYKAFLTNDSINVLFWNSKTNNNKFSKEDSNDIGTLNFNRNYWLHQLQYYYTKNKNSTTQKETEPILLVQTHADALDEKRNTTSENTEKLNIKNEFFVSLSKDAVAKSKKLELSLNYLVEELKDQIRFKKQKDTENKSIYDADLITLIKELQELQKKEVSHAAISVTDIQTKYKEKTNRDPTFLTELLQQLSRKGMLLFYPENENLEDTVWLHPEAVVAFIHKEVLKKEVITKNEGVIPEQDFKTLFLEDNKKLIDVLLFNQAVFLDETTDKKPKYIIPGYLPLADANDYHYFLFDDLRQPNLTLKFEHFIPFGFMNRLICFYGGNDEKKLYWKDQLLFTTKNKEAKVLIQLNFEELTIKISIKTVSQNTHNILHALFLDIIALYWNEEHIRKEKTITKSTKRVSEESEKGKILESNKENNTHEIEKLIKGNKIPDAYISLNGKDFIKYDALHTEKTSFITSYPFKEDSYELDKNNGKSIPILPFKHFTFNKNLNNMKKIFISYSKKDLAMVNTFQDHLSALQRDGKVGTWYCTELKPADDWSKEIQQHFDESDIVCFMVSPNFMKTDYIFKHEIPKAFQQNKKIVPIILDFCNWQTQENNLTQYNGLPYTAKPIKSFKNENEAWYAVVECLRLLIDNNALSLKDDTIFTGFKENNQYDHSLLRSIYERIVTKKADA